MAEKKSAAVELQQISADVELGDMAPDVIEAVGDPSNLCPICMDTVKEPVFKLACGHIFCQDCVTSYVTSAVTSGQSDFGCVFVTGEPGAFKICGHKFSDEAMQILLKSDQETERRYLRFKFFRDNRHGRECPNCEHLQIGKEKQNQMICAKCSCEYCFLHGGAHNGKTCAEYEDSIAEETKSTNILLNEDSKPCPGCGIYVSKVAGCNHMKCTQCKTSFCWICGKQIGDDVFPNHFQWWNPAGCMNMQMSEEVSPSQASLRKGQFMACLQIIALGLCTALRAFGIFYISSLLTFCLCGMCCIKWGKDRKETLKNATNTCGQHMTVWGGIWMFLLVLTPAAILFGTCYVILTTILVLFNCILLLVRRLKTLLKRFIYGQTETKSHEKPLSLCPIKFSFTQPSARDATSKDLTSLSNTNSGTTKSAANLSIPDLDIESAISNLEDVMQQVQQQTKTGEEGVKYVGLSTSEQKESEKNVGVECTNSISISMVDLEGQNELIL